MIHDPEAETSEVPVLRVHDQMQRIARRARQDEARERLMTTQPLEVLESRRHARPRKTRSKRWTTMRADLALLLLAAVAIGSAGAAMKLAFARDPHRAIPMSGPSHSARSDSGDTGDLGGPSQSYPADSSPSALDVVAAPVSPPSVHPRTRHTAVSRPHSSPSTHRAVQPPVRPSEPPSSPSASPSATPSPSASPSASVSTSPSSSSSPAPIVSVTASMGL